MPESGITPKRQRQWAALEAARAAGRETEVMQLEQKLGLRERPKPQSNGPGHFTSMPIIVSNDWTSSSS